jgi:hypothetical protein
MFVVVYDSSAPAGFREIRDDESRLLQRLLTRSFHGSAELREQFRSITVAQLDAGGSLRLATRTASPAEVDRRIPVEASYADRDGIRVHLLLHVVDGYLDELEAFREDGAPVVSMPAEQDSLEFDVF